MKYVSPLPLMVQVREAVSALAVVGPAKVSALPAPEMLFVSAALPAPASIAYVLVKVRLFVPV